jgi:thiol-disulfide isomerase/thioredoxin
MRSFTTRAGAVAVFALLLTAGMGCGGSTPPATTPSAGGDAAGGPAEVGKPAPELKFETVNGKGSVTLESLAGKIAVVDFWATWCGPCKQSFPKLEEIAKQNAGKVQVVGISVDDKADGVADFAKANGATFAVGWDDGHTNAGRWKVETMPTTYILDATGKVRFVHAGYKGEEGDLIAKELATLSSEPSSGSGSSGAKSETATADKPAVEPEKPAEVAPPPEPAAAPAKPTAKKPPAKKPAAKPVPKKK